MTSAAMDLIIDADAHVVESDHTWDYLDPSDRQYRPQPLESREDAGVKLQFWLIDGKVRGFRFPAFSAEELERRSRQVGRKFADIKESREMGNVDLRLEYMDQTGVDIQVLHNTMFIESATERIEQIYPGQSFQNVLCVPDGRINSSIDKIDGDKYQNLTKLEDSLELEKTDR